MSRNGVKECAWCSYDGVLIDNEGEMICVGCIESEIQRLRRLLEEKQ